MMDIGGIPAEFVIFAFTLLGVAVFHSRALEVAAFGLLAVIAFKLAFSAFPAGPGLAGFSAHFAEESVVLVNLLLLLTGFALLARHFELSHLPTLLPRILPGDWKGGVVLLALVFALSSFLDNIAAAIIGGTMAAGVFANRVHIGYLAAIVAASNAGGSGSVIGDTTTTMMWIEGVPATDVLHAYIAAFAAFFVFAIPASFQQQRYSPIQRDVAAGAQLDVARLGIVTGVLLAGIAANLFVNLRYPDLAEHYPFLGLAVWFALLLGVTVRAPDWGVLPEALKGSIFLLCLVASASLMPVERLPLPSWHTTLGLGFVSAVFDNIPLTKLALEQGGYDWGFLAFAVGFGGSMTWFGSSAGVALSNRFPEARSVGSWLRHGWYIALAYVFGFFVLLGVLGWHP